MAKIGIIGVGNIGGALAHSLLSEPCTELYLYDIKTSMAKGKAQDLRQAAVISGYGATPVYAVNQVSDLGACDVIVVIAGLARQPGMDRSALLHANADIISSLAHPLKGTNAVIVVVTNPVDTMTGLLTRLLELPFGRVVGMASILDEGRLRSAIAKILKINPDTVTGAVIGAHNDSMVPLLSSVRWGGVPLTPDQEDKLILGDVLEQTRRGGANIVQLLGQGSAYYGPAEAARVMVRAIVRDENLVVRCSVMLQGEYGGVRNICCGVPVVLGRHGVKEIIEYPLKTNEMKLFQKSIETLQQEAVVLAEMIPSLPTNAEKNPE